MHCSDIKKETIYIKDEDKWEIEKKDRPKLKHALKKICNKSVNCLYDVSHTENFEKTCMEVLKIEDIMDRPHNENLSDLKVSKDEIIENVAEKILNQEKSVGVIDKNNQIIGTVQPSKIINTVFGVKKNND